MRAHIIGIAGSGKTTLAASLGAQCGADVYDLDLVAYDPAGIERPPDEIAALIRGILATDRWITEGAYRAAWMNQLLEAAYVIVWLDLPFRVCAWRILRRHVRAEIARNNAHPGWIKLMRFVQTTRRTDPELRAETGRLLEPYLAKITRCRSSRDVATFSATDI